MLRLYQSHHQFKAAPTVLVQVLLSIALLQLRYSALAHLHSNAILILLLPMNHPYLAKLLELVVLFILILQHQSQQVQIQLRIATLPMSVEHFILRVQQ